MDPEVLASLPFLSGLSPDRIRAEGHLLQCFAVGAGETLIREGEVDDGLLVIVEGEVAVQVGARRLEVARAGRGEVLGETALFRPAWRRESTLSTTQPSTLIVISGPSIQAMRTAGSPLLAALEAYALTSLGRRLRRMALNAPPSLLAPRVAEPVGWFQRVTGALFGSGAEPSGIPDVKSALAGLQTGVAGIDSLAPYLRPASFYSEEVLLSAEVSRPALQLVVSGEVELRDARCEAGEDRVVGRLGAGSVIDPVSLVHGHTPTAQAVGTESGCVLSLSRENLEMLLRRPGTAGQALRQLLYTALFSEIVDRNTAWCTRWEAAQAA
jgi:CRP-like cAMP-binding protein